jgi:hypothetical protein
MTTHIPARLAVLAGSTLGGLAALYTLSYTTAAGTTADASVLVPVGLGLAASGTALVVAARTVARHDAAHSAHPVDQADAPDAEPVRTGGVR